MHRLTAMLISLLSLQQMTLEEYEAVLAEKRAGLNQTREAAYKADEKQVGLGAGHQ